MLPKGCLGGTCKEAGPMFLSGRPRREGISFRKQQEGCRMKRPGENWDRFILYFIIVASTNFFGNMPCFPDMDVLTAYDPLQGTLQDNRGTTVAHAQVLQSMNYQTRDYFTKYDSTGTDANGSYTLVRGVPNEYKSKNGSVACESKIDYAGTGTFYLVCIHPFYDTTVALFTENSRPGYQTASDYNVDTLFIGAGTISGAVGAVRLAPIIRMKPKTH